MAYGCRYRNPHYLPIAAVSKSLWAKTYANAIGGANKFQYIVGNGGTKFRGNLHSDQMGAHKAARSVTRTIALATSAFNARSSPRMNGRCSSLTAARPLSLSFIMSR